MRRRTVRILGFALAGLIVLTVGIRFAFARMLSTGGVPADAVQKTVLSKDGTPIAWEQTGTGPVVILVSAALVDRDGTRPLARELASSFTVVNYDRRGRRRSGNAATYTTDRELEDIDAIAATFREPVFLFGSSSGAVLALDAASRLQSKVKKVFLYEPPFIVDASHPPVPESLAQEVAASVAANDRSEAVGIFFRKAMGIPAAGVTFMRLLMPACQCAGTVLSTDEKRLLRSVSYGAVATCGPLAVGMGCWLLAEKAGTAFLTSLFGCRRSSYVPLLPGAPFGLLTGSVHADNFSVPAVAARTSLLR